MKRHMSAEVQAEQEVFNHLYGAGGASLNFETDSALSAGLQASMHIACNPGHRYCTAENQFAACQLAESVSTAQGLGSVCFFLRFQSLWPRTGSRPGSAPADNEAQQPAPADLYGEIGGYVHGFITCFARGRLGVQMQLLESPEGTTCRLDRKSQPVLYATREGRVGAVVTAKRDEYYAVERRFVGDKAAVGATGHHTNFGWQNNKPAERALAPKVVFERLILHDPIIRTSMGWPDETEEASMGRTGEFKAYYECEAQSYRRSVATTLSELSAFSLHGCIAD